MAGNVRSSEDTQTKRISRTRCFQTAFGIFTLAILVGVVAIALRRSTLPGIPSHTLSVHPRFGIPWDLVCHADSVFVAAGKVRKDGVLLSFVDASSEPHFDTAVGPFRNENVTAVAVSSPYVVFLGTDLGRLYEYDTTSFKLRLLVQLEGSIIDMAACGNGEVLVLQGDSVNLLPTGRVLTRVSRVGKPDFRIRDISSSAEVVDVSYDGRFVAVSGSSSVVIYRAEPSGLFLWHSHAFKDGVTMPISFDPRRHTIAIGGKRIRILDLDTKGVRILNTPYFVSAVAWSPNGKSVILAMHHDRGSEIVMADRDGSELQPIYSGKGFIRELATKNHIIVAMKEHEILFIEQETQ